MGARLRILALLLMAALLAGAVWARLAYWQVFRHVQLSSQAQAQYHELVELPAVRGVIFDRNLTQLVVNTTVYSAFVSPDQIAAVDRERVATGLSGVLSVDKAKVMQTLQSNSKFAFILRRFSKAKADQLRALKLPGVGLADESQRSYLPGITSGSSLAANLLGFANVDGQGRYGLEQYYQKELGGTAGYISSYRDLANREIILGTHTHQDPVNGSNLVLSLDANVQYQAEQALMDGVKKDNAESGSVLIMDPSTGGIVAWADYPSYDANNFNHTDSALFQDNVASYLYEPGSVLKVVTLSGAINQGAITPDTVINDPGVLSVGGFRIYDWDHRNHGNINYRYVLAHSLNVGAMKAMLAEGHAACYSYLKRFGLVVARQGLPERPGREDRHVPDPGQRAVHAGRLGIIRGLSARQAPQVHDARGGAQAALSRQRSRLDAERRLPDRRANLAEDRPAAGRRLAHDARLAPPVPH